MANSKTFYTPELFAREQAHTAESPRGRLLIASCRSGAYLARKVIERYEELLAEAGAKDGVLHLESIDFQFSDTETCVRLDHDVSGYDVFLFQALFDPTSERGVDENIMALLIAARAFREWGANHITAVTPYLAYARQDKPTKFRREPTTANLIADLGIEAGIDRMIVWHAHSEAIGGFYDRVPVHALQSLTLFMDEFHRYQGRDDVIAVAPDAGALKFITYFGRALNLHSAIGSKHRPRQEEAEVSEIIGDFEGKRIALVLDDMMSTGGTVDAIIRRMVEEKGIEEVYLGISHNLCAARARDRLLALHKDYGLREMIVTNSVPQTDEWQELPFLSVRDLADTLSRVVNRIHYNRSVGELFYQISNIK